MGHQITFYALPSDIHRIESAILDLADTVLLHRRSQTSRARIVPTLDYKEGDDQWLFYCLSRRADVDRIELDHVATQGYWSVDTTKSPVVEFTRCFFDGSILRRGRVWYTDGYYNHHQEWQEKSPEFREWAQTLFKSVRRLFSKSGSDYIGPAAKAWANSGGSLVAG